MQPGKVIGDAWALYRAHWGHLVSIAFVFYLLLALLTLLLVLLLGGLGAIAAVFVSLAGVFWLQGVLVEAIADVRDGRADLSIGQTFGRIRPRVNTLALAGLLASLGITIGFVLLIVPGLVLLTWWSLIVPVIVLERAGILESFGRSRELIRGNGWNMFGLIVLTIVILIVAAIVVGLVLRVLPDSIEAYVANIVSSSLTAPFAALAWTLAYFELRGAGQAPVAPGGAPPATPS